DVTAEVRAAMTGDGLVSLRIYDTAGGTVNMALVGHWPLDETAGLNADDATAVDGAIDEYDGTLEQFPADDSQWVAGTIGGALQFDGVDDIVVVSNEPAFDLYDQITISCWVKVTGGWATNDQVFVAKRGESGQGWQLRRDGGSNRLRFTVRGTSGADDAAGSDTTVGSDDVWHHIVGVYDGARRKMYLDGALYVDIADTGTITATDDPVSIGGKVNGGTRQSFHRGQIDDVRIYHRALSEGEIYGLYSGEQIITSAYGSRENLVYRPELIYAINQGTTATAFTDNLYEYLVPLSLSDLTPDVLVANNPEFVMLGGTGFSPDVTVSVGQGGTWWPVYFNYWDSMNLRFLPPALPAGDYSVRVELGAQVAQLDPPNGLTVQGMPDMTDVTPKSGPTLGGTQVTIDGVNFDASTLVTVGYYTESDLVNQVIVSPNQITGEMPPCTRADLAGNIVGFPTTVETRTFTVQASDGFDTTTRVFTIEVKNMAITPTTLGFGETGVDYYESLTVKGGVPPHTWSVSGGSLPPGLSLDSASGGFSGAPTVAGSYNFTVQVTDSAALTATQDYTIDVYAVTSTTADYVRWEAWTQTFADFTALEAAFAGIPDARKYFLTFNGPIDWDSLGDIDFGVRMSAVVEAPQDGDYIFSIASGGQSELYISTDDTPANLGASPIAWVSNSTAHMDWSAGGEANQNSAPITLVAGQKYYIEARYIALAGNDHLAVAWEYPDATLDEPIWGSKAMVPGVVLHYEFDEAAGVTAVNDSSGNGFHGTSANVTTEVAGRVGTAYDFNGSSSTVTVPSLGLTFTEATFVMWVNIDALPLVNMASLIHTDDWSGGSVHWLWRNGTFPDFCVNGGGEPNPATVFTAADIGTWIHVAAVYDSAAGSVEFYLDGQPDGSGSMNVGRTLDFTSGSDIGSWNGGRWYDGQYDDFRIYDVALSEAEIDSIIAGTDKDTTAPMEVPDPSPTIIKRPVAADSIQITNAVTVTQNSRNVGGTDFWGPDNLQGTSDDEVSPGDFIRVEGGFSGAWVEVVSVADNALTLYEDYAGTTDGGTGYAAPSLPKARVGTSYDMALSVGGGISPYTWVVTGGGLPPGVTLDPNGWLMGSPSASGVYTFVLQVTDTNSLISWPRSFTIYVLPAGPTISTSELPPAVVGLPYETSISAVGGGGGDVDFSIILGQLPDGLHLNAVLEPFNFWVDVDGVPTRFGPEWGFVYVDGPSVSSINPDRGPWEGGTSVTISGTKFPGPISLTGTVDFDGSENVTSLAMDTLFTQEVGVGDYIGLNAANLYRVVEVTDNYNLKLAEPGPIAAGAPAVAVPIRVKFVGREESEAIVRSVPDANTIVCETARHYPPEWVSVQVVDASYGGVGELAGDAFLFTGPRAPEVFAVYPDNGPVEGNTQVLVTGDYFEITPSLPDVYFGGAITGDLTFTIGLDTVSGTGLTTQVRVGDYVSLDREGEWFEVTNVTDTVLTLGTPYDGQILSGPANVAVKLDPVSLSFTSTQLT
ncbi:MAG: LamG-like jellyroll fold domain-containing protein, partial [Planctomycetota bacterium]